MKRTRIGSLSHTSQGLESLTYDSGQSVTKNQGTWDYLAQRHVCIMWERFSVHRHTYAYVKVKSTRLHWISSAVFRRLVLLALTIGRSITVGSWLTLIKFSSSQMETMLALNSVSPFPESCPILLSYKHRKAKTLTRYTSYTAQITSKKR